jgi:preprotein translocase subunit SecD
MKIVVLLLAVLLISGCSSQDETAETAETAETSESTDINYTVYRLNPSNANTDESQLEKTVRILRDRLISQEIDDGYKLEIVDGAVQISFDTQKLEVTNLEDFLTEISLVGELTFREGNFVSCDFCTYFIDIDQAAELCECDYSQFDFSQLPLILTGADVKSAVAVFNTQYNEYEVQLEFNDSGKEKFYETTVKLAEEMGVISIWIDDVLISAPTVQQHIIAGIAQVSGNFTRGEAVALANQINGGALPFALEIEEFEVS